MTYVLAWVGLKALRTPRRVLVALWILNIAGAAALEASGDRLAMITMAFLLTPVTLALAIGWLWVVGYLWQRIGLSRVGTAWRNMAVILLGAVHWGPTRWMDSWPGIGAS